MMEKLRAYGLLRSEHYVWQKRAKLQRENSIHIALSSIDLQNHKYRKQYQQEIVIFDIIRSYSEYDMQRLAIKHLTGER